MCCTYPQTLLVLYTYPSSEIAVLCVDFWSELITVLTPPEPGSPVYHLLVRLIDASLPHLVFPEVGTACTFSFCFCVVICDVFLLFHVICMSSHVIT